MPKHYSYGDVWKDRMIRLLKAVLQYANDELEDGTLRGLEFTWQDANTSSPTLIIRTKLRILESLSKQVHGDESPTKDHIRDLLNHYLKDFLGILKDYREKPKGSEHWHFSLTLWAKETQVNLQRVETLWGIKRSGKVEGSQAETSKSGTTRPVRTLKPGAPFQAPPLPKHYILRPEHFDAVKAILLNEGTPGTLVISAIYGMGGIGKSVLAAALVQDSEVQMRFADGVLWVTLGQQPDLLSMVNLWIRELGDYDYNPTTLPAASLHLRTLLADKQVLLVVDDVWNPEHVEPFRIGGAGCCVLVTTRQTKIVGATRYDLELMTPQQSLDLLTQCLPAGLSATEQAQAEAFAKEVGYLPLALELAAAQIEYGVTWEELLEAFQAEMADPEALDLDSDLASISDEAIRKGRSLVASFKLTLKLLSSQQLEQFAWMGIVPEDVSLTQQMAATLWGVKSLQSGAILREFRNRALLLPQAQKSGEKLTYRIHDLVHDLSKHLLTHERYLGDLQGLGMTVVEAHTQFLERYWSQTQNGLWHTVPDDGYIHAHLSWHFEQAQQPELLHQLLQETTPEGRNGWYEACDKLGRAANFVTDIERAWQMTEQAYDQQPTASIGLQVRYALITTTLNSLAQNIPPELIATFVKKQFWTPSQGLAYVRQAQESQQRVRGIAAIAPLLPPSLLTEAISLARNFYSKVDRSSALTALAPHGPESVFHEALDATRSIQDEFWRAHVLRDLAYHLPDSLFHEVLDTARSIQDKAGRAIALSALVPHGPPSLLDEALNTARSIQDNLYRARALSTLVPHGSPSLLNEALDTARSIQSKADRAIALSTLVPHGPPSLLNEALDAVKLLQDEYFRAQALSTISPYLPEFLFHEALNAARAIQNEFYRARALSALAPHDPESLFHEALDAARTVQPAIFRAVVLGDLAPHLPESLFHEAIDVARSIRSEFECAIALRTLASEGPDSLLDEALDAARSIQNEFDRAIALRDLTPHLPGSPFHEALDAARSIQNEFDRAIALRDLAPHLPESLFHEALDAAITIQNKSDQAIALSALSCHRPDPLLHEALSAAKSIQNEHCRVVALRDLAPHLPEALLDEALDTARSIQNESERAIALRGLAPHLPKNLLGKALDIAKTIQDEFWRAIVLRNLAPYGLGFLFHEALDTARSIQNEQSRAHALCLLAPNLPEPLLCEILDIARAIQSESERARALSNIAPYGLEFLFREALNTTRTIPFENLRAFALRDIAPNLPELLFREALDTTRAIQDESDRALALRGYLKRLPWQDMDLSFWQEIVHALAALDRNSFIQDLPKLRLGLVTFGGEDAVIEMVQVMKEVCTQWP